MASAAKKTVFFLFLLPPPHPKNCGRWHSDLKFVFKCACRQRTLAVKKTNNLEESLLHKAYHLLTMTID
jgi:hypothetical protein